MSMHVLDVHIFPGINMGSKENATGLHFVYIDKRRRIALF